ncbi:MAG: subclass B1 metallo-beta-lactamase [Ignavibacteriaceae bacterium]
MKHLMLVILVIIISSISVSRNDYSKITVSEDIQLIKISDNAYVHIAYIGNPPERFPCDGLIFIEQGEAFLFDTPMSEEQTKTLVSFIQDSLNVKVVGFVPNHWHDDCTAGMAYLHTLGVESYANEMTIDIMKEKNLPPPKHGFRDSLVLDLNGKEILLNYFGAGHASDNITAYIPSENILFGGCMVKETRGNSLGNLSDANLEEWPKTIQKVLDRYPDAKIVIPGHGNFGGVELLEHTITLLNNNPKK